MPHRIGHFLRTLGVRAPRWTGPVARRPATIDQMIIHVDDWEAAHEFYANVPGQERVDNPEGAGDPLGARRPYRLGGQQITVHGPWPGRTDPFCPPPLNEVGPGCCEPLRDGSPTTVIPPSSTHQPSPKPTRTTDRSCTTRANQRNQTTRPRLRRDRGVLDPRGGCLPRAVPPAVVVWP
jgi:hypothetical protein